MPTLHGLLDILGRTVTVYVFMLVGLRLSGKREIGQMTVFDLVVILIISNAVQNAMVGPDTSLGGGLIAATALLLLNHGVSWLRGRWKPFAHWVGGMPTEIVKDGRFVKEAIRHEGLSPEEIEMAMREHGVEHLSQVHRAVLETDGSISIVPIEEAHIKRKRRVRVLKKGM